MGTPKVWTDVNGRQMLAVSGQEHASFPVEDIVFFMSTDEVKCRIVSRHEIGDGQNAMVVKHTYQEIEQALNDAAGDRNPLSDSCTRPTD